MGFYTQTMNNCTLIMERLLERAIAEENAKEKLAAEMRPDQVVLTNL